MLRCDAPPAPARCPQKPAIPRIAHLARRLLKHSPTNPNEDTDMKLNGSMLVAVAMMMGAVAVTGCSKPSGDSAASADAVAPEESVADAPVKDTATDALTPGVEQDARGFHYYAPHGPPAARFEERGRAPSERHFWAPGYYRWNGREHIWNGGRWEMRREGYDYYSPRWENVHTRWAYRPGYWARHR